MVESLLPFTDLIYPALIFSMPFLFSKRMIGRSGSTIVVFFPRIFDFFYLLLAEFSYIFRLV